MDLFSIVDIVIGSAVGLLLGIQMLILYFLPKNTATKLNFTGRILEYLANTKKGFSNKEESDDKDSRDSKNSNNSYNN